MSARIFKPSKTAMQSGRAKTKEWVLEFEPKAAKRADPLMGWAGSTDTNEQVTLVFATKDEAVAYANRHGIAFSITAPQSQVQRPKAYADNFRFDRVR
jgi:hypothetical protein